MTPHTASDARPQKQPRIVLGDDRDNSSTIFAFPPNRDTLGGTAYFIRETAKILVDCPAWNETNQAFLEQQGGVDWLFLSHRDSIGKAKQVQQVWGCEIVIQEQEAYLLPGARLTSFQSALTLTPQTRSLWTAGHSPGSSCLYHSGFGGVLFTGRHILPTPEGTLMPTRTAKTFHWGRQVKNVQRLLEEFSPDTLNHICPGANLGFLRGEYAVENAYEQLQHIGQQVNPIDRP